MGKKRGNKRKVVEPSLLGFQYPESKQPNYDRNRVSRNPQTQRVLTSEEIICILDEFTHNKMVVCANCKKKQKFESNNIEMLRQGCTMARLQQTSTPEVLPQTINCDCTPIF